MRRAALVIAVFSAAALPVSTMQARARAQAQAQASQAPSEQEDVEQAFSAQDDLDCAMFAGALLADDETALTPDNRIGLTSAFTYFVGRYEARRGIDLTTAFAERYPQYLQRNPAEIQQVCSIRMRAFSSRLQAAGSALTRLEPPRSPALQGEPSENPAR